MIHIKRDGVSWTRSSFCGTGGCVEVSKAGPVILVRDGKIPLGAGGVIQPWEIDDWREMLQMIRRDSIHWGWRWSEDWAEITVGLDHRQHEPLTFSSKEWEAFVEGVLAGDFEPENLQAPAASSGVNAAAGGVEAGDDTAAAIPTATGAVLGGPAPVADGGPEANRPELVISDEIVAIAAGALCASCDEQCGGCYRDARTILSAAYPLLREQWEANALKWGAGPLVAHNETSPASGSGEAAAVPPSAAAGEVAPELEETGPGATEPGDERDGAR